MRSTPLNTDIYILSGDKGHEMIYKVSDVREIGSSTYALCYNLELVAGKDYVNPDESNMQGFVPAYMFTDSVQGDFLTVNPLQESLGDRLKEEGYEVINIADYTIHIPKAEEEVPEHLQFIEEVLEELNIKRW